MNEQKTFHEIAKQAEELAEKLVSGKLSIEDLVAEIGQPIEASEGKCGVTREIANVIFANSGYGFDIMETVCGKCILLPARSDG